MPTDTKNRPLSASEKQPAKRETAHRPEIKIGRARSKTARHPSTGDRSPLAREFSTTNIFECFAYYRFGRSQ
jgi:hypothetical protein